MTSFEKEKREEAQLFSIPDAHEMNVTLVFYKHSAIDLLRDWFISQHLVFAPC